MPHPEAQSNSASDLHVGMAAEFERDITEADILAFARHSGDWNPLHTDDAYAQTTKLGARVVQGAFQVAMASAMAGMHLPGRSCFLVSCHTQFQRALYFPCRIAVRGEITAWEPISTRGSLRVTINELPSDVTASQSSIAFTLHELKTPAPSTHAVPVVSRPHSSAVLVTGASGGIGSSIVAGLCRDFFVFAAVHRSALAPSLQDNPNVSQINVDLAQPGWFQRLEECLGDRPLSGVVHAAWPSMEHGGLLSVRPKVLEQQLAFATSHTIDLARLLLNRAPTGGGRLVVLGSIVARNPLLSAAAYSLAKAALEQTIRLLAPELAVRQVTINAVCPSFVPTGINSQATERQKLVVKAGVPLGRLCTTDDIVGAVRYLFSAEAAFVSGQAIVLSGGQL